MSDILCQRCDLTSSDHISISNSRDSNENTLVSKLKVHHKNKNEERVKLAGTPNAHKIECSSYIDLAAISMRLVLSALPSVFIGVIVDLSRLE